jgi:hypothetical protein
VVLFTVTQWPEWTTVLAVDAMYLHAARQSLRRALVAQKRITRAERRLERHQARLDAVTTRYGLDEIGAAEHYDELEPLAIQMEGVEHKVGAAYGPFLQQLAAVHIFAAASLEAHINDRGQARLKGQHWAAFEKLPLETKWLHLPPLLGLPAFEPGAEPYQGFSRLVRFRNKLIHYRPKREKWRGNALPPTFLSELGLSVTDAEQAIACVGGMVKALAVRLGAEDVWWVDADEQNYFVLEVEKM